MIGREVVDEKVALFADLLNRLDLAAQSAPRRRRRLAQALVLEEFWRIARLHDDRLTDACCRAAVGGGDADADALQSEMMRRGL